MSTIQGRGLFSLSSVLASFFGALMVASAFAYYNYKFSEYKFIDFNEHILYAEKELFKPNDDKYIVIIYSSNMQPFEDILKKIDPKYKILAIDLYQHRLKSKQNVIHLTSNMNVLLKIIQRFNIYDIPTAFIIEKQKDTLYKQASSIEVL